MKKIPLLVMTLALASCTGSPVKKAPAPTAPLPVPAPLAPPPVDSEPLSADLQTRKQQFIADTAKKYGIPESEIRATLSQAVYKQSIVNAMARPAESTRTWASVKAAATRRSPVVASDRSGAGAVMAGGGGGSACISPRSPARS